MAKTKIKHISIEEELSDYVRMIKALAINYLNIYVVQPEQDKGRIIKLNGYITEGIVDVANDFDYFAMLQAYAAKRVYQEDIDYFLNNLNPKKIIETFSDGREQMEFSYRVLQDGAIHYYSAHYIRISRSKEPLRLVAGFRNVDQIMADRVKDHDTGMSKAYAALANVYYSMYRIDVTKHTFREIKTSKYIKEAQIPDTDNFDINADSILRHVVQPSFLDEVLEFCNLETLEDKMKGKDSISIEFVGSFSGWVRASFIKEDLTADGKLFHVLWAVQVIDDVKQRENELRILAESDQLSGILNRGTGERKIKEMIEERRSGIFCLMDVDHFKIINDTYGHEAGDYVIKEIASCLKKNNIGKNAITMRLGGDEFASFIPDVISKKEAERIWNEAVSLFEGIKLSQDSNKRIFVSAGATLYDGGDDDDFNSLYKKADDAMYKSKKADGYKITFDK